MKLTFGTSKMWKQYLALFLGLALICGADAHAARDWIKEKTTCSVDLNPIKSGYGSKGNYQIERVTVPQQGYKENVPVFMPSGKSGERFPVVFFSHGYGPNISWPYEQIINHLVSRGNIVIYAPFPMAAPTIKRRYDILWNGFDSAVRQLQNHMDLTKVAFIGHSFGGGANPYIAYRGIVENGWGSRGALLFELAPWYSYEMSDTQFKKFPQNLVHAVQLYDMDQMNDHRMAFDLQRAFGTKTNLVFLVRSANIAGCNFTAEHMFPARSKNPAIRQYSLLRPLDFLMDVAFKGVASSSLEEVMAPSPEGFRPLELVTDSVPIQPESYYHFKWSARMNPRKSGFTQSDIYTAEPREDLFYTQDISNEQQSVSDERPLLRRIKNYRDGSAEDPRMRKLLNRVLD
jgi:pimeloyl-ACP methyl ester carboxylesterase